MVIEPNTGFKNIRSLEKIVLKRARECQSFKKALNPINIKKTTLLIRKTLTYHKTKLNLNKKTQKRNQDVPNSVKVFP